MAGARVSARFSGLRRFQRREEAGEGNRTLVTSLEGWGSTVELRPQAWNHDTRAGASLLRASSHKPYFPTRRLRSPRREPGRAWL